MDKTNALVLTGGIGISNIPSFGTLAADSSDSTLFSGYTPNVAVAGPVSQRLYFGKSSGTWTTLWTDTSGALLRGDEAGTHAVTLASNGPEPFDTDTGIATDTKSGSVAAGTTFSHTADMLLEFTVTTLPSAGNVDCIFRYQDANNYWVCRVNAPGALVLIGIIDGSQTVPVFVDTAVLSGDRVVIIAESSTIKMYVNNVLEATYSSASTAATATAGEVDALGTGGVVSDLKTWPRTLSGTAASILNKASG